MTAENSSPPPADTPATAAPTPPADAKPPAWPTWFSGLDAMLGLMAVVFAFMLASFVARNTDFWRHIAAGKLVVTGAYPFGGDPFTYTAAGRAWVNPNWLGEVLLYALYSADTTGAVVVVAKAVAFAAAFGLLFLVRRGNSPLWPWAVAAALGALGACAFTQLRPYVFGLLLYSAALVTLFRGGWDAGKKWRMPLALGGLTLLWANTDGFAFLVPLTVAALWAGELIHEKFLKGLSDVPADADPFPPVPPAPALARALLVTAVAVLLNPTFLGALAKQPGEAVAQLLPFELDYGTRQVMAGDDQLARVTHPPVKSAYYSDPLYGNNPTGYAAAALAAACVALVVVGYRGGRASHLFLWLALALLSAVVHARFVGPLMLVSVVLAAAHLNALSRRLDLTRLTRHTASQVVLFCQAGRVLTVAALAFGMIAAWPGWLQVRSNVRPLDRWVAWQVEPDEGMKRAAELLQGWRTDPAKQEVLAGTHGLMVGTDLGDYCAWFAPAEKAFINSRYRLHRAEMDDFVRLRQAVYARKPAADADTPRPVTALADKYGAGYVCLGQGYTLLKIQGVGLVQAEFGSAAAAARITTAAGADSLWHLDGRFAVLGRVDTPEGQKRAERMVWDVTPLAFGVAVTPTEREANLTAGGRPNEGWEYDFLVRPKVVPAELDDSSMYSYYAEVRQEILFQETQRQYEFWGEKLALGLGAAGGGASGFQAVQVGPPQPPRRDYEFALPFLAARAARRAIAGDLDRSTAFIALAQAYQQQLLPETESDDNRNQAITAYTRALARMPDPAEGVRTRYTREGLLCASQLFRAHLSGRRLADQYLDLARDALTDLNKLLAAATDDDFQLVPVLRMWSDVLLAIRVELAAKSGNIPVERIAMDGRFYEYLVQSKTLDKTDLPQAWVPQDQKPLSPTLVRERMKRLEEIVETLVRGRNDLIESRMRGRPMMERFKASIDLGLPGKALDIYQEAVKANQNVAFEQTTAYISLMYHVGRLEAGHDLRLQLEKQLNDRGETGPEAAFVRQLYRQLELTEAKLAGDFKKADAIFEELSRANLPPKLTDAQRALATARPEALLPGLGAAGGFGLQQQTLAVMLPLQQQLYAEAFYSFQRGLFALHAGDTKAAKRHFDQAAAPQGVPLDAFTQQGQLNPQLSGFLPKYRELLQKYGN